MLGSLIPDLSLFLILLGAPKGRFIKPQTTTHFNVPSIYIWSIENPPRNKFGFIKDMYKIGNLVWLTLSLL